MTLPKGSVLKKKGVKSLKNIIQFKLKVFISSAMGNENQTQWKSIRKSIVKTLSKCAYLEPYKIEDHTSEISSTQLFSYRVRQSDIVVILIQNERQIVKFNLNI